MRWSILMMLGFWGIACGLLAQTAPAPRAGSGKPPFPPAAAKEKNLPVPVAGQEALSPPVPANPAPGKAPADPKTAPAAESPQALPQDPAADPKPKYSDEEYHLKKSYAYGRDIARGIKADEMEFDLAMIIKGLTEGLKDAKSELTEQEHDELMLAILSEIEAKAAARYKVLSEANQKAAVKFLAENAKKEGIATLPSGLQYQVLKKGAGASPKETESVLVHLKGTLLNGSTFVSTLDAKQPTALAVGRVIKGLREALLLMKKGDRWQIILPAELAFGANGNQAAQPGMPNVGPAELVIYEVELLEILETVPTE